MEKNTKHQAVKPYNFSHFFETINGIRSALKDLSTCAIWGDGDAFLAVQRAVCFSNSLMAEYTEVCSYSMELTKKIQDLESELAKLKGDKQWQE